MHLSIQHGLKHPIDKKSLNKLFINVAFVQLLSQFAQQKQLGVFVLGVFALMERIVKG
jgi:hypothetical protein